VFISAFQFSYQRFSWWFRIWAVLWFGLFIAGMVALGTLGRRADIAGRERDFHTWYENTTQMYFPRFHFRIPFDSPGVKFSSVACRHNNLALSTNNCEQWQNQVPDRGTCVAIPSDGILANHYWEEPDGEVRIDCVITTTFPNATEDALIAWELEGPNHAAGGNALSSVWIAPNDGAWLILSNEKMLVNGKEFNDWTRRLIYHSTVITPGKYAVSTILGSFMVAHIEQADSYPGWRALGEVGGFTFFMVIIHSCLMLAVSFCFTNNSKFLGGESE